MKASAMISHITYLRTALIVSCSVVLMHSPNLGGAVKISNHSHYINERTELEMLWDGLRMQERITEDILPEVPHNFDNSDRTATTALYREAVKQVLKLKSAIFYTRNSTKAHNDANTMMLGDLNLELVFNRVMEDACNWLTTVLPPDFNCTVEELETLYTQIDLHDLLQDTRKAVRSFHEAIGDNSSNFDYWTQCSWINYRVLDDCNTNSNLTCIQEAFRTYMSASDSYCGPVTLRGREAFYLCQEH